jgi:hypothetical protein
MRNDIAEDGKYVYKTSISEHRFAVYMDKKQFMELVKDMLMMQQPETTVADLLRVINRVLMEDDWQ